MSIVNFGVPLPSVSPAFNTGCVPGCTVLDCSCTAAFAYWSSSSLPPLDAWFVNSGSTSAIDKTTPILHARAVRDGERTDLSSAPRAGRPRRRRASALSDAESDVKALGRYSCPDRSLATSRSSNNS
jgi:hypothetical protein